MGFEPTEVEKAYLAGFFDGEGWVGIYVHGRYNSPELRVSISQKDVEILHWIQDRYNGNVALHRSNGIPLWQATTHVAYKFLTDIRPYLRFKAAKADECIAVWLPRSKASQPMKHYNSPEQGHVRGV